jgi:hypothetical protein
MTSESWLALATLARPVGATTLLLIMVSLSEPAHAKKKRLTLGCTDSEIQTTKCDVGAVTRQDGKFYYKVLYCNSAGNHLCCQASLDTGQIVDHSCTGTFMTRAIKGAAAPRASQNEPSPRPRSPRDEIYKGPGLLEPSSGFGTQGPAQMGGSAAPSAPPPAQLR